METQTAARRRSIVVGILSAETTIAWLHPAGAEAVALTGIGGTLLVILIALATTILGSSQTCERVFRLLRWLANRPEPPGPDTAQQPQRLVRRE